MREMSESNMDFTAQLKYHSDIAGNMGNTLKGSFFKKFDLCGESKEGFEELPTGKP